MKLRPTIFLSGVSSEFGSFRDAAEIEVQKKDCFPINQPSFGVDYRELEEILRAKLMEADAVIHVVGFRLGFEPQNRPANTARRSYTQMEYDIARELKKPVYVFLSAEAGVRDADYQPEDAEAVAIQLSHRQALQSSNNIRYTFRSKNELCNLVAGIPLLATADFRVDISRIDKYAPAELIGREAELALLDNAWLKVRHAKSGRPHVYTFVALGGEGKTSLVAKWLANLAYQSWPGCDSAFAWSFYSQGTREQGAASSDLFLKEAITFFGNEDDRQFAASSAGAYEKGQRLARIVGKRRSLLILDGVEPLQYSPTSPTRSELKDAGLIALLKALAANSDGLCVITTRYSISNLMTYWQTTAPELELRRLSRDAGVHLLKTLGVHGTANELETLVEAVKGHALTLNLLGSYLRDAHGGDIRRRDLVRLEEADWEEQGGHAFRVMEAYERGFEAEGERGKIALAILRLLGLFDRPISAQCLAALLKRPAIKGLTQPLVSLREAERNLALKRLENAKLVTISREAGTLASLDAHPLLREYFARQLRTQQPKAWRKAHHRLYEYLCTTTDDKDEPTLEDLQPLYQAVAHGCQAGLIQQTAEEVYRNRIVRKESGYTKHTLGAFGSDLGAVACFFSTPWIQLHKGLTENAQAWLLNDAAYCLRALGRFRETSKPMQAALELRILQQAWSNAATVANNLSEMELALGHVDVALEYAEQGVAHANRSNDTWTVIVVQTTHANALHASGRPIEAETRFREAERMQAETQPTFPLLYSVRGFSFCNLLLAVAERAAWNRTLERLNSSLRLSGSILQPESNQTSLSTTLREVANRATQLLQWDEIGIRSLLDAARNCLTLGLIDLYEATLFDVSFFNREKLRPLPRIDTAVNGLRRAAAMHYIPDGLLARAWARFFSGIHTGPDSAQEDLDEAWEIAESGPMRLFMADIHLYRARLFFREEKYPWGSAQEDLEAAEKLINECGYHRRDEELADAKRVILGQSA